MAIYDIILYKYKKKEAITMNSSINLQDVFLNQARKEKMLINIFLTNGFQFKGTIKGFDNFVVVIECDAKQHLVYKHAISTIVPSSRINIFDNYAESTEKTDVNKGV